jgi:hypothetical protein
MRLNALRIVDALTQELAALRIALATGHDELPPEPDSDIDPVSVLD